MTTNSIPSRRRSTISFFAFFNNQDEPTLKVYDESLMSSRSPLNLRTCENGSRISLPTIKRSSPIGNRN